MAESKREKLLRALLAELEGAIFGLEKNDFQSLARSEERCRKLLEELARACGSGPEEDALSSAVEKAYERLILLLSIAREETKTRAVMARSERARHAAYGAKNASAQGGLSAFA